ncbi:MAG: methyltransferase domain-containing protein [Planctomycetes bacterium]|nr:methyltransferase domain-containing protein [Planctomycetota bacterium]
MKKVCEHSREQARWNQKGQDLIEDIQRHPNRFIVDDSRYSPYQIHQDLVKSMGRLKGKRVLDLGSGRGNFSVFLTKQGAKTMGVDLGPQLMAGARSLAAVNHVDCEFQEANVSNLPFEEGSYDIVVGLGILHHLSQSDLKKALQETYRVLKKNGVAFFCEPVENSKVFDFIQNIFPAGKKGSNYYRPSILQRKAWRQFVRKIDERPLTNRELVLAGGQFARINIRTYGLLIRFQRLIGRYRKTLKAIEAIDKVLLRTPLRYLCQTVLVEYRKDQA